VSSRLRREPLVEVIESRPPIVENWRSSGVATADAMVSGFAPGRLAVTCIVGKSTFGRSFTGSSTYAPRPKRKIANMTREVMIGLRINNSGTFTARRQG
jgi:hypothetical protein